MKQSIHRSIMRTSMMFTFVILFLIINIISKFSYIDLAYLLVVIGYFIVYLKKVSEM